MRDHATSMREGRDLSEANRPNALFSIPPVVFASHPKPASRPDEPATTARGFATVGDLYPMAGPCRNHGTINILVTSRG